MADAQSYSPDTLVDLYQELDDEASSKYYNLEFSDDEGSLVARMFRLVGQRWSLIAGRIPGRTPEEVEKYWTSMYLTANRV